MDLLKLRAHTTGEAIATKFIYTQEEFGIVLAKMLSQGYDDAANMAGMHHGVQADQTADPWSHLHANKESLVRSIMDTLQQIAVCFNYSAKRLRVLQAELELDEDANAGMNNKDQTSVAL